ncbi:MAG: hypothetical protein JW993_01400 [Sedimentisphaerales bacterium]|nr:hypothetical protein [Sedimentisphaerales bacterium]
MARSATTTVAWLGLLWLLAAALTIAAFYTFIIPDYRDNTFYVVMSFFCFAELILAGYTAYLWTVPHTVQRPSRAMRLRVMVLIVVWLIAIFITGILAVRPSAADTWLSDKILLFHLILTFLLLVGVYMLHRADVAIQVLRDAPERQRVTIASYSSLVQTSIESVRSLGERHSEHMEALDGLAKRLDTLKSQLLSVSPAAQREQARAVAIPSVEGLEDKLRTLQKAVAVIGGAEKEAVGKQIASVRKATDTLIASLREREDMLSY